MEVMVTEDATYLVSYVIQQYNYLLYENEDPRYKKLPMMGSVTLIVGSLAAYFILVCYILPKFMARRKPFKLREVLMVYNQFQVILNVWIIYLCVQGGWFNGYSFTCQPGDFSESPKAMMMVEAVWWYFLSKYLDLLDTVFFVLRKSFGQVSFLHHYHHISMPFWMWYISRFTGGGHWTFLVLCNSFIHVLMYTYYLLAALGYKNFLWWKRYLTLMQMIQFVIVIMHQLQVFFIECPRAQFTKFLTLPLGPSIFILFVNFYMKAYLEKDSKRITAVEMAYQQGRKLVCLQA